MIIIDKRKDYYDGLQANDQDRSLRYIRTEKKIDQDNNYISKIDRNIDTGTLFLINFCGKIYPCIQFSQNEKSINCYSIEEIDTVMANTSDNGENYFYDHVGRHGIIVKSREKYKNVLSGIETDYFNVKKSNEPWWNPLFQNLCEKHKSPVILIYRHNIVINPLLRPLQFIKARQPYEAYQDIRMWLSNLAMPDKVIPVISDELKAESKGFNKYSFRRDPSSHPKRKK